MSDIRIDGNKIDISFVRHEAMLDNIGKQLDSRTLHSDEELSNMSRSCDALRSKLSSPEAQAKLVTLYGRVDTKKVNNQVDQVVENSFILFGKREKIPQENMTVQIGEIQSDIASIWYQNALSIPNRRFIKIAVHNLSQLQVFPSSKTADVLHNNAHTAFLRKDKDMLPESELRSGAVDAEEWESAEFAFDLCEMAHSFYQNKMNEGMKKLHQLTPSQKNRLEEICLTLGADYPTHFLTEDVQQYQDSMMRFVQALVGYANEVAQGEPLMFSPSESEIHMMFQEVENLKSDE